MNKRIKELANQMFSMEQFEYAEEFLNDEFMEKFAELIVQECKSVLLDMTNEGQGEFDTLDLALTEINEHFGVQE